MVGEDSRRFQECYVLRHTPQNGIEMARDTDPLTRLPQDIIHHILSFLPNHKEVTRSSVISKAWFQACRSFRPILNFDVFDFLPQLRGSMRVLDPKLSKHERRTVKRFLKYVDRTMSMFQVRHSDVGIQRFSLKTTFAETNASATQQLIDRWIAVALDNRVSEMNLSVDFGWQFSVPERVFTDRILKSLTLDGFRVGAEPLTAISSPVNLKSLQSLELRSLALIDNQMLQRVLQGCPLLENLAIFDYESKGLSEIRVFGLCHLTKVDLEVDGYHTKLVEIDAPSLQTLRCFCCTSYRTSSVIKVVVDNSPNLKSLEFQGRSMEEDQFHELISKFPLLESLQILLFSSIKRMKITNPLIQKISLAVLYGTPEIEIYSSKLLSFRYKAEDLSTIVVVKNPSYHCEAHLSLLSHRQLNAVWFKKLRKFLTGSCNFRTLSFLVNSNLQYHNRESNIEKTEVEFPTSAIQMENLYLAVHAPPSTYSAILDGLLSTCHPTTIMAPHPYPGESFPNSFVKFLQEKLANRKEDEDCFCSDDTVKCWMHQLKSVTEIEEISQAKHEGASNRYGVDRLFKFRSPQISF